MKQCNSHGSWVTKDDPFPSLAYKSDGCYLFDHCAGRNATLLTYQLTCLSVYAPVWNPNVTEAAFSVC